MIFPRTPKNYVGTPDVDRVVDDYNNEHIPCHVPSFMMSVIRPIQQVFSTLAKKCVCD